MKTLVIGAGITGVTSAYFLNAIGHDVTVTDSNDDVGLETSFANGGQISISQPFPWSSPNLPKNLIKWLGRKNAPLVFRLQSDPFMWRWALRFLMNGRSTAYYQNAEKILQLALTGKDLLADIVIDNQISCDRQKKGILKLYDKTGQADAEKANDWLKDNGVWQRLLDRNACIDLEPALKNSTSRFIGGTYTRIDESGDALKFTTELANVCRQKGVLFKMQTKVTSFETSGGLINNVILNGRAEKFDNIVLAAGTGSRHLGKMLGLEIPVYPVKGYSVTLPVINEAAAPVISLTDDANHIVISRLGNRIRAAGTAEIGGYDLSINSRRTDMIMESVMALFPDAVAPEGAEFWAGLRPMTPDCVPIIGQTKIRNLYLNTGHGALGWTLAAGSAFHLSQLMAGKETVLDSYGYCIDRF